MSKKKELLRLIKANIESLDESSGLSTKYILAIEGGIVQPNVKVFTSYSNVGDLLVIKGFIDFEIHKYMNIQEDVRKMISEGGLR